MANLVINMNLSGSTSGLRVTRNFKEITLDKAEGHAFFSKVPKEDVKVELVSTNEDAEASFPIGVQDGKKGAVLEVVSSETGPGLELRATGEFSIKIRKGADTMLKNLGSQLDLRVRAVIWKGGSYNGFCAPMKGGDYEQVNGGWRETFPKIEKFLVK